MTRSYQVPPLLLFLLMLLGCDPGLFFKPNGWSESPPGKYARTFEGFEITIGGVGGLIGNQQVVTGGCIINRGSSSSKFEIVNPVLRSGSGAYQGKQDLWGPKKADKIAPGNCQPFEIQFDFAETLDKVLIEPVLIEMNVQKESTLVPVSMSMERH